LIYDTTRLASRVPFHIDRHLLLTSFVEVRRAFTSIWLVAPRDLIFFQDAMTDRGTGQKNATRFIVPLLNLRMQPELNIIGLLSS
jgi:hypothetical protein